MIDHQLTEWGRDPATLEDEGVDPPPPLTVQKAIRLAEALRDEGMPNPQTVVRDPNGDIVFERAVIGGAELFHVWDDGQVEFRKVTDGKLIERRQLH